MNNRVNPKVDTQIATEMYYNKKAIRERIENEINREPELMECMLHATIGITRWATNFDGYASKRGRLDCLLEFNNIGSIVRDAMVLVMMLNDESDLITSLAGQMAGRMQGFDDHEARVVTAGEILTLMCDHDCFDMEQLTYNVEDEETGEEYPVTSWFIRNPWELSDATVNHIKRGMYLPPMIVQPRKLYRNTDSAYITIEKDSLILGKGNHHNGDICLDSLNLFNSIPLAVNTQFITSVDTLMKESTVGMDEKAERQYMKFMEDSYHVYAHLVSNGNRFFLTHKPDKRGRTYAQG